MYAGLCQLEKAARFAFVEALRAGICLSAAFAGALKVGICLLAALAADRAPAREYVPAAGT